MAKSKETEKKITAEADIIDSTANAVEATEPEQIVNTGKSMTQRASSGTAKAGKRSAKAVKEAEAEEERQARKTKKGDETDENAGPAKAAKPSRSRLERRGRAFRQKAELIEKGKAYSLQEAIDLAIKTNPAKFDATVELHVNLNVDPRHADQNVRDSLVLPAGTGKKIRVAVFDDATVEGADIVGVEAITKELDKGRLDFDVLIATPAQMPKLGKYARVLGPRGLMPNPKSGTVTSDVNRAVAEAKAGRIEYRVDSTGIIHVSVGKVSFTAAQLRDNLQAVLASIKANKPASVKGTYVKAIHLSTTMGPSITLDTASI